MPEKFKCFLCGLTELVITVCALSTERLNAYKRLAKT